MLGKSVIYLLFITRVLSFNELVNRTNIIDRRSVNQKTFSKDQSLEDGLINQCGSCAKRQDIRNRSLENIKEQILFRLGMQEPLNTTGRKLPQVTQDMLTQIWGMELPGLNEMLGDQPQSSFTPGATISEEVDDLHIKTENVMTFAKPYPRLRHGNWKTHGILYFQFSEKVTRHRVNRATMYFWIKGSGERRPSSQEIILEIFKVVRDSSHPETPVYVRKARTLTRQSVGNGHWAKIDASALISEWFKSTKDNYGFTVNATLNGEKIVVTDSLTDGGTKVPFVDVQTTESRKRRTKRTVALNCNEDTTDDICCRYPLTVDFEEFGWDFIIAPKKYEAYYCSGDCPYATLQKYAHTHLVTLTHPTTAGPCCAPRKMSPIDMLYFDKDLTVIYGKLPGMVVDRCGCS